MDELVINVVGEDIYFKLGIISLVQNQWGANSKPICISEDNTLCFHLSFDFNEDIAVINTSFYTSHDIKVCSTRQRTGNIYTPFNCRRYSLAQIEKKLVKILEIVKCKRLTDSKLDSLIINNDIRRYQQLSQSEFLIMTFIGQGLDCYLISKKMNRSIKTIRTHYRSASRKLGFDNQADFFRFAKYISKNNQGVINTLCL